MPEPVRPNSSCCGCGALLEELEGPTHGYMKSSPACFQLFGELLAFEYSDPALLETHRLTVDTYAVQHPGSDRSRREIQSVGLHLARLMLQLENSFPPKQTNDVMLGLGRHKATLEYLEPPAAFTLTVADMHPHAGGDRHSTMVRNWATATWTDWTTHHEYIRAWTNRWLPA